MTEMSPLKSFTFTFVITLLSSVIYATDYCLFSPQHALCGDTGIGPACNEVVEQGLTDEEKKELVNVHNELRSKVANGDETNGTPGPQPPASDMHQMYWDEEIEKIAQSHANKCIFKPDCEDCRKTARFSLGQTLWLGNTPYNTPRFELRDAINGFYHKVNLHSNKKIDKYEFISATNYYTQLVWATSNRIGCGYIKYKEGMRNIKILTCNYGPAGNLVSLPIYQVGDACSNCSEGFSCSSDYSGLCAIEDPFISSSSSKWTGLRPSVLTSIGIFILLNASYRD